MLRDEAPWLSEILLDINRDLTDSSKLRRASAQKRLRSVLDLMWRGHPTLMDALSSKESYVLLREASHLLERIDLDFDTENGIHLHSSKKRSDES